MAISVVQHKSGTTNGTSLNVSFDSLPAVGNHVLVYSTRAFDTYTITDNQGHTYSNAYNNGGNEWHGHDYTLIDTSSGTFTVTLTKTGSGNIHSLVIIEVSGLDTSSPADVTKGNLTQSGSSPDTGVSAATDTADEIVIAAAMALSTPTSLVIDSPYTGLEEFQEISVYRMNVGYLVVSSTGTQQATWTGDGSGYDATLVTYRAAAVAITVVQHKQILASSGIASGSFASTPTVGNTVIAIGFFSNGATRGMGDNQSNSYAEDAAETFDAFSPVFGFWSAPITTSSGTFTITPTSNADVSALWMAEVSGLGAYDVSTNSAASASPPDTGATAATSSAIELVIAIARTFLAGGTTLTPDGSYVELDEGNIFTDVEYEWCYLITSSTGAQQETWTPGSAVTSYYAAIATYAAAVTGQTVRPVGTSAAGAWTASTTTLHGDTSDDSDATYDQLLAADSGSTMILTMDTIGTPGAGTGTLTIRVKAV